MFKSFILFFNTVKYLKTTQVKHQVLRRIYKKKPRKAYNKIVTRNVINKEFYFISKAQSIFDDGEFRFFGRSAKISQVSWAGNQLSDLWRYNQHYFDDLTAEHEENRQRFHIQLIDHWIAFNPPGVKPGWDAYPTSLRIVNWINTI